MFVGIEKKTGWRRIVEINFHAVWKFEVQGLVFHDGFDVLFG